MKNYRKLILILMLGLLIVACSNQNGTTDEDQPADGESSSVMSGACGISYFPILPDKTWVYRIYDENDLYVENRVWYEDISDTSFTWKQEMESDPPITTEVKWNCSDEGLVSTDYVSSNLPMVMQTMGVAGDYQIETLEFGGVTFPASELWQVGSEWTGSWKVKSQLTIEDMGLVDAEIAVTKNDVISGEEPVSVPAGSYDKALRVDSTMLITTNITMQGMTLPAINGEYTMTSWFVEGVGMVKQVSEDASFMMELGALE